MTTKPKPTIPAKQLCIWLPIARHGANLDERRMPVPLPDIDAIVEKINRTPCKRVFVSEPFGADASLGRYGFMEEYTSQRKGEWIRVAEWGWELLRRIELASRVPVVYCGAPHTQLDESHAEDLLRLWRPHCEYAFDAASGEPAGGICHRVVTEYGGRKRFWIEAHPPAEAKHWEGYRVCMLANQRRRVEEQREKGYQVWRPSDDDKHPTIAIMMTGHGRKSIAADVRDSIKWAQEGHTIGIQLHEWDRWAERVDLGGEG